MFKTSSIALLALVLTCGITQANDPVDPNSPPVAKAPHCQVPCGIYGDQMRFEMMLEDTKTIAKAIASINEFSEGLGDAPPTAKGLNQLSRWVSTKEDHANNTQKIIAEYFLAQRIKDSNKDYTSQLVTAHKVIVAAMKCKQDASAETAEALKKAIFDLYRAYEGKEPNFAHEEE